MPPTRRTQRPPPSRPAPRRGLPAWWPWAAAGGGVVIVGILALAMSGGTPPPPPQDRRAAGADEAGGGSATPAVAAAPPTVAPAAPVVAPRDAVLAALADPGRAMSGLQDCASLAPDEQLVAAVARLAAAEGTWALAIRRLAGWSANPAAAARAVELLRTAPPARLAAALPLPAAVAAVLVRAVGDPPADAAGWDDGRGRLLAVLLATDAAAGRGWLVRAVGDAKVWPGLRAWAAGELGRRDAAALAGLALDHEIIGEAVPPLLQAGRTAPIIPLLQPGSATAGLTAIAIAGAADPIAPDAALAGSLIALADSAVLAESLPALAALRRVARAQPALIEAALPGLVQKAVAGCAERNPNYAPAHAAVLVLREARPTAAVLAPLEEALGRMFGMASGSRRDFQLAGLTTLAACGAGERIAAQIVESLRRNPGSKEAAQEAACIPSRAPGALAELERFYVEETKRYSAPPELLDAIGLYGEDGRRTLLRLARERQLGSGYGLRNIFTIENCMRPGHDVAADVAALLDLAAGSDPPRGAIEALCDLGPIAGPGVEAATARLPTKVQDELIPACAGVETMLAWCEARKDRAESIPESALKRLADIEADAPAWLRAEVLLVAIADQAMRAVEAKPGWTHGYSRAATALRRLDVRDGCTRLSPGPRLAKAVASYRKDQELFDQTTGWIAVRWPEVAEAIANGCALKDSDWKPNLDLALLRLPPDYRASSRARLATLLPAAPPPQQDLRAALALMVSSGFTRGYQEAMPAISAGATTQQIDRFMATLLAHPDAWLRWHAFQGLLRGGEDVTPWILPALRLHRGASPAERPALFAPPTPDLLARSAARRPLVPRLAP